MPAWRCMVESFCAGRYRRGRGVARSSRSM